MPDDYNQHDAESRHYRQMTELQGIRDGLTRELNYYYDYVPKGENDEREERRGLYDRLVSLRDRLDEFVRKLY